MIGMRHKEKFLRWLAAFYFLTWVSVTRIFTLAHQAFIFLSVSMFYFIIKLFVIKPCQIDLFCIYFQNKEKESGLLSWRSG